MKSWTSSRAKALAVEMHQTASGARKPLPSSNERSCRFGDDGIVRVQTGARTQSNRSAVVGSTERVDCGHQTVEAKL